MTHEADDRHRLATEVIARAPLFRGVPPSARATVLDAANVRRLEPGTRLLSVGQRNTSLFISWTAPWMCTCQVAKDRTCACFRASAWASCR
jgi:hypothetical protein